MTGCVYNPGGPRLLKGRHLEDCTNGACMSCHPCTRGHCGVCGIEHVDDAHPLHCPECIGATRQTLREIRELCHNLREQAAQRTRDTAPGDRLDVMGGDAMVMLGPWSYGHVDVRTRNSGTDALGYRADLGYATVPSLNLPSDQTPPLLVLATWEDDWRNILGHDAGGRATIAGCVDYLDRNLYRVAQIHLAFPDFAREVREIASRLESVIHDEQGGYKAAPCPKCHEQLVREVLPRHRVKGCPGHGPLNLCPLDHDGCQDTGGAADTWECPRCEDTYTAAQYRHMVARDYRDNATALAADDLEVRTGVKVGTIRVWAKRGKVAKRGKDAYGRQLYDVADVLQRAAGQEVA